VGSVCALHISPKSWNNTMNNGIKTRYQQIVDAYSKNFTKCRNNLLKLGNLETIVSDSLSKVYGDYIVPVEERFVYDVCNQELSYSILGNLAVYDILEGKLNGKSEENIPKYSDLDDASWSCFRLGGDDMDMYVIATVPLPMYVNPGIATAFMGDKGWGVLESVKAKYKQPALPTTNWLASLQKVLDPTDLAPVFGIISHNQVNKWLSHLDSYIVKHSDSYKRKGIRNVQVKLSDNPQDRKFITKLHTKKRRTRKRKHLQIIQNQKNLFDY